jgi:hypothetical protein
MRTWALATLVFGIVSANIALATEPKEALLVDSAKATYKEVVPGVSKALLWGDPDKGPYGAFTKFKPGHVNPLHTHSSDLRVVVLKGAYIYKPEKGEQKRVGPGQTLFVPGGDRHVSEGDAKEETIFYEESLGKFDLNLVK